MLNNVDLPGSGKHWVKLKGVQGWKNTLDNTIWKRICSMATIETLWIEPVKK